MLADVRLNIADTIGVPFEILAFENSTGAKGICQIYNEGAAKAQYDLLCFVHEDVSIKTANWGQIVSRIFNENPKLGLLGVAGASYKPLSPSGWGGFGNYRTKYLNILQDYKYTNNEPVLSYNNSRNDKMVKVACVDGVWFCTTKQVLAKVSFDEQTFKSFHAYDLDFSMAVRQHYEVAVTFEVLIHHFSEGNFAKDWFTETVRFHQKWVNHLPVATEDLPHDEKFDIEKETFRIFVGHLIKLNLPASWAYRELLRNLRYLRVYPSLFFKNLAFIGKAYRVARKENV